MSIEARELFHFLHLPLETFTEIRDFTIQE